MNNPYADGRLYSYRQQRMKTPINRNTTKEDNLKAFQELEQLMENRSPSSQAKLQSKAVLLKGLISKNGKTEPCIENGQKLERERTGLDKTTDTQEPMKELSQIASRQELPTSRVSEVGSYSPSINKNGRQGKKAELLKKFDVTEKRTPNHLAGCISPKREDRSRSVAAKHNYSSTKNFGMQRSNSKIFERKPYLAKYITRLQELKLDLQKSSLLRNSTQVLEAFNHLADLLRREQL